MANPSEDDDLRLFFDKKQNFLNELAFVKAVNLAQKDSKIEAFPYISEKISSNIDFTLTCLEAEGFKPNLKGSSVSINPINTPTLAIFFEQGFTLEIWFAHPIVFTANVDINVDCLARFKIHTQDAERVLWPFRIYSLRYDPHKDQVLKAEQLDLSNEGKSKEIKERAVLLSKDLAF